MKVHGLIPSPDSVEDPTVVDATTARLALDPARDTSFIAHGVQLELPSVSLWVTQVPTEQGWTFKILATTPHAEGGDGRVYGSVVFIDDGKEAAVNIWAGLVRHPDEGPHT